MSADGADGADGAGVVVSVSKLLSLTQPTAFHRMASGVSGTFFPPSVPMTRHEYGLPKSRTILATAGSLSLGHAGNSCSCFVLTLRGCSLDMRGWLALREAMDFKTELT